MELRNSGNGKSSGSVPTFLSSSSNLSLPEPIAHEWLEPFLIYLEKERRYSAYTLRNYRHAFEDFYQWLIRSHLWARGLDGLKARDLRDFVIEGQRRFDRRTLHLHVSGLRAFFKYWLRHGRVTRNPFIGVPLPKLEKRLPKFLTEDQMKQLLTGPSRLLENETIDAFTAWRDRLAMELLYGGGLRVSELVALNYGAIDTEGGVARVLGKGQKERLCPLGVVALAVLKKFKNEFARAVRGFDVTSRRLAGLTGPGGSAVIGVHIQTVHALIVPVPEVQGRVVGQEQHEVGLARRQAGACQAGDRDDIAAFNAELRCRLDVPAGTPLRSETQPIGPLPAGGNRRPVQRRGLGFLGGRGRLGAFAPSPATGCRDRLSTQRPKAAAAHHGSGASYEPSLLRSINLTGNPVARRRQGKSTRMRVQTAGRSEAYYNLSAGCPADWMMESKRDPVSQPPSVPVEWSAEAKTNRSLRL